jgi:two-component system sensor histidine kinase BaeS
MRSLRARLLLSHLLPMLVIVPLVGIALIYALETRVLLPAFLRAYSGNAALVAEITTDQYRIWSDPIYAQTILARVSPRLPARVMLLAADGRLMASSDPNDLGQLNQVILNSALPLAQDGQVVQRVFYNRQLQGEALDIWEPVIDTRVGGVIGIVRITYEFASISDQFVQLRTLIAGVLLLGLAFGGILGLSLAVSIDRPLRRVTEAVNRLAQNERSEPLPQSGPNELRQLTGAVNSLVDRLHGLEESRRHLLANLVHELGRPLGALRSAVQALLKGAAQDPELGQELLTGMDGELVRLQSLLGELTHMYDQVLGNLEMNREPLPLGAWLSEVASPWESAAHEKGLAWATELPGDLPEIHADSVRLGQAVGNLLSNAVKFTPPNGKVTLSAGSNESEVWIRVEDSGPGISFEEQEKIFTPFYRGSQGRRFVEGMGLGLSIARDLVQAHGGRLELVSTAGEGSRFTIHLPKG